MKHLSLLILSAVCALFVSCGTSDLRPLLDAASTAGVITLIENSSADKKEGRIEAAHEAADGLEKLATGAFTRQDVQKIVDNATGDLLKSDPQFRPLLSTFVLGYFPVDPGVGAVPVRNPELAATAVRLAGLIRTGLPPKPTADPATA